MLFAIRHGKETINLTPSSVSGMFSKFPPIVKEHSFSAIVPNEFGILAMNSDVAKTVPSFIFISCGVQFLYTIIQVPEFKVTTGLWTY